MLKGKIIAWQQAGLISKEQANDLLFFESHKKHFALWLKQLAFACVFLGILAIVASNWQTILPVNQLKLTMGFILILAISAQSLYQRNQMQTFEVVVGLLYLVSLLYLVNLGSYFQVLLSPYQVILFWIVATFPSTYLVRSPIVLSSWIALSTLGIYGHVSQSSLGMTLTPTNLFLSMPFIIQMFAIFGPNHLRKYFTLFAVFLFGIAVFLLSFNQLLSVPHNHWRLLPGSLGLLFWLTLKFVKPLHMIESVSWLMLLMLFNLSITFNYFYGQFQSLFLILLLNIITMLTLSLAALLAYQKQSLLISKIFIALAILRAIIFYFEAFGGLLFTGMGLIMTGSVLMFLIYLTRKSVQWINLNFSHSH